MYSLISPWCFWFGGEFEQFFPRLNQCVLVVRRVFRRRGAVAVFVVIACADEGFAVFVVAVFFDQGFFFFVGVGVAVAVDEVAQAAFARLDFGKFFEQGGDGKREFG